MLQSLSRWSLLALLLLQVGDGYLLAADPTDAKPMPRVTKGDNLRGGESDDVAPVAENPMIRGLEKVLDSTPTEMGIEELRMQLRQADSLLSRIKADNLSAIREANRQQRLPGQASPNIILIVVQRCGEATSDPGRSKPETPSIDKLAADGIRLNDCTVANRTEAALHWSVMTGLRQPQGQEPLSWAVSDEFFTLAEVLWKAGYTTGLIGDCSLGGAIEPAAPSRHGLEEWFGYCDRAEVCDPYPENLCSKGARLRVPTNADGGQGQYGPDLLLQATVSYLNRHRRGSPFFLYLAWPIPGESSPASADTSPSDSQPSSNKEDAAKTGSFDHHLGMIVERLEQLGIRGNTVVFLIDEPTPATGLTGPVRGRQVSLIVSSPGHLPKGISSDHPCRPCDILPTLVHMVRARRRPGTIDGESLVDVIGWTR